ncbi:MAG: hypothetical protein EOP49_18835 [Sphingobacteriales bacterium]|nr:MAG: hypothetical protein EOP49_18835 [Sphingobacteriales bacterium]
MKKLLLPLLVLLISAFTLAKTRTVTGTVIGYDNLPIPGVAVSSPGKNSSTITNEKGKYSISVDASVSSLTFRYLGMIAQTKSIPASNVVNVTMVKESQTLSSVVVTGLGRTQREQAVGYSISPYGAAQKMANSRRKPSVISTALCV